MSLHSFAQKMAVPFPEPFPILSLPIQPSNCFYQPSPPFILLLWAAETTKSKASLTSLHHVADTVAFSTPRMKPFPMCILAHPRMCFCLPAHWDELIPHKNLVVNTFGLCLYLISRWGCCPSAQVRHPLKSSAVRVRWPTKSSWHEWASKHGILNSHWFMWVIQSFHRLKESLVIL